MQGQPDRGAPGIPAEGVASNEGGLDQPVEEENANNNEEMDDNAQNEGNEHKADPGQQPEGGEIEGQALAEGEQI